MKQTAVILAVMVLLSGAAYAEDLKKLSLDDASTVGLKISADPEIKVEGKASVKITTPSFTSVCLGEISGLDVENHSNAIHASERTETGQGYAQPRDQWRGNRLD